MKSRILIAIVYAILACLVIKATPPSQALLHDANTYYQAATSRVTNNFIDQGYPLFLRLFINIFGENNIIALQVTNYIIWIFTTFFIYKSANFLGTKKAKLVGLLMLFSPLYMSFSAKLYSEPLASLGVALLVYGTSVSLSVPLFLGALVLAFTKSIFVPGIILLSVYFLFTKKYRLFISMSLAILLIVPIFHRSLGGGRSLYNLSIERAKLDQSYDQILACIPYYLSYPLGQKLLPQYQGICHQNDPSSDMPGYDANPYVRAVAIRENGFTYRDWWGSVLNNPLKYLVIFLVALSNLVLFEGVYPSILLQLPGWIIMILFITTKIMLVTFLWYKVIVAGKKNWLYLVPIIYLMVMIGNFQVEPRYIYPLIPYIYFLVAI
jgi:hypothetical protein